MLRLLSTLSENSAVCQIVICQLGALARFCGRVGAICNMSHADPAPAGVTVGEVEVAAIAARPPLTTEVCAAAGGVSMPVSVGCQSRRKCDAGQSVGNVVPEQSVGSVVPEQSVDSVVPEQSVTSEKAADGNGIKLEDATTTAEPNPKGAPGADQSTAKDEHSASEQSSVSDSERKELINGLVLDKRKRDEDDESPELKKAKLETKALKAKRPGFTDERYTETSYWFENGLRKVYPYYFTFTTFTKGRWVGEKILDVFAREFRAHPAEEYERCIRAGTLTVNYNKVDVDHRLRHNDLLANVVHRHEVPITAEPVPLVHIDDDLVVVDKPSSIPVHPCGRYRHNTVVFILAKEHGLKNLRTIHRLDRLTSGLLMFGRTPAKARDMEQQIRTRQVTKEYVCRVEGQFPSEPISSKEPIEVVSYKIGVCKVSPKGKECLTEFSRLSYNGRSSVVLCRPHTGRMHQIRVHLQYLGYPIINDPLYNHTVFGPDKGRSGNISKSDEQLIQDLIAIHNAENWLGMDGDVELSMFKSKESGDGQAAVVAEAADRAAPPSPAETSPTTSEPRSAPSSKPECTPSESPRPSSRASTFDATLLTVDTHCYECKVRYRDPKPSDLVMYLHALKYSGPGWEFETKMPDWASETWSEPEGAA